MRGFNETSLFDEMEPGQEYQVVLHPEFGFTWWRWGLAHEALAKVDATAEYTISTRLPDSPHLKFNEIDTARGKLRIEQ